MSRDTLVLAAFCIFIVILVVRMRQRYRELKNHPEQEERWKESRWRYTLLVVQFVVLGGLMLYMVPLLMDDFERWREVDKMKVFLRCLIFIFTIYTFIGGLVKLRRLRNKGDIEK